MKHLFTVLSLVMTMLVIIVMESDNYYNLTIPFILILSILIYQRFKEEKREQWIKDIKQQPLTPEECYTCKLEDLPKTGVSGWSGRKFIVGGNIIYAYSYNEAFNIYLKNYPH